MIEYIKILLISLVCGVALPLPVSSGAHLSFINGILDFSDDKNVLGLYYSVMSVAFSLVIFVFLRKIYLSGIKSLFRKDKKLSGYRKLMKNILISLIPSLILFVPVSEDKLLCDIFDGFLVRSNILLVAVASVIGSLVLVISIWYTRQGYSLTKRSADTKTVIRTAVYQIVSYVIPGISRVSSASTNMLICDVESKVIIREIYLYIAPQMLLINTVKIIRFILADVIVSPLMIAVSVVSVVIMSAVVVTAMSRINIRRIFAFFAVYGGVIGAVFCVISFVLK